MCIRDRMVGVQATAHVLAGERYKNVSKEIKAYLHGEYGRAPGEINREIKEKILGDDKPVTVRYADLLEPCLLYTSNAAPKDMLRPRR